MDTSSFGSLEGNPPHRKGKELTQRLPASQTLLLTSDSAPFSFQWFLA